MDSPEVETWAPTGADVLRGTFHLYEATHWAVRTEDGTVWLLEVVAEDQLRALRPDEGQQVQVMYLQEPAGASRHHVSIH